MSDVFVNKVAASGILTLDLEKYLPAGGVITFDLKDHLFMGLILKEKDFREALRNLDWNPYQDKYVAVTCSVDAIIPVWAYMLVATYLQPVAKDVYTGTAAEMQKHLFLKALAAIDIAEFNDQRVVVKGCGDVAIEPFAYAEITKRLRPVVKSIMYGEPCSTVPVYKKEAMKKWIMILLGAGWLAACNDAGKTVDVISEVQDTLQEATVDAEMNMVQQSFPQLFQYLKKQDATFSEDSFLIAGESQVETVPPMPLDKARMQPFQKYLIYNADSSKALDLYSYSYIATNRNGAMRLEEASPDLEAAVIDFKQGTRKRIFFAGPSQALWDAKWTAPDELLLVSAESHRDGHVTPTIWHINLRDTSIQVYAYEGELTADISGYRSEKLDMGF